MIAYLDSSAAIKLIVEEAESDTLADYLEVLKDRGGALVASLLLQTELRCAANMRPRDVSSGAVDGVLSNVQLFDLEREDLATAPFLPGRLRSADAIHLATALRTGAEQIVVYDKELSSAAGRSGIHALSPS